MAKFAAFLLAASLLAWAGLGVAATVTVPLSNLVHADSTEHVLTEVPQGLHGESLDSTEEFFPWQFQLEADRRFNVYMQSKIDFLTKRLAAKPDDIDLLIKLGRAKNYLILAHHLEYVPEVLGIFNKVLALKPGHPVALAYHGSLLLWSDYLSLGGQKGRTADADRGLQEMQRAIDLAPQDLEVRMTRAFAIYYGVHTDRDRWVAVQDLQVAVRLMNDWGMGPNDVADTRIALGDVYFSLGRVHEAQTEWKAVRDAVTDPAHRQAAEVRLLYRQGLSSAQRLRWPDVLAVVALLLALASLTIVASQPLRARTLQRAPVATGAAILGILAAGTFVLLLRRLMQGPEAGPAVVTTGALQVSAAAFFAAGLALLRVTREPLADALLQRGGVAALFAVATVALFQYVLAPASWKLLASGAGSLFTVLVAGTWTALALSFPLVQRGVSRFLNRRLFHREESTRFLGRLGHGLAVTTQESDLLAFVERELRDYLRVRFVRCVPLAEAVDAGSGGAATEAIRAGLRKVAARRTDRVFRIDSRDRALTAATNAWGAIQRIVMLRPSEGGHVAVLIGGGRPVLSGEDEVLALAATQFEAALDNLRLHDTVRQRAVAGEALARLATQAELRALQAQIHPHFLFNTLNSIAGLIPMDPKRAEQLVEELADLLRYRFRAAREFIPLSEELSLVHSYLQIEQVRLGARLRIERDVTPEALAVPVPPLLVQPLVENAVTHGVGRKNEGGCVRITARIVGENLELCVEDDGAGMPLADSGDSPASDARLDSQDTVVNEVVALGATRDGRPSYGGHGVGLANVLARVKRIYGDLAVVDVESVAGAGTRIRIVLPVVPPVAATTEPAPSV